MTFAGTLTATLPTFPRPTVVALAQLVAHLSMFGVESVLFETRFFAKFAERTHMLLGAGVVGNLCVSSFSVQRGSACMSMWRALWPTSLFF